MSLLIVEVCRVDEVNIHPNADKLEILKIKGWDSVVQKGLFKQGQKIVYIPPDSIIPMSLAERIGIAKYVSPVKDENGNVAGGRVRVARLRTVPSYGTVMECENDEWEVGHDVAEHYNITKWDPPQKNTDGEEAKPLASFHKYTDIQNIKNFPDMFTDGEEVVFTEKLHGKNARAGVVKEPDENGNISMIFVAGSHETPKREFATFKKVKMLAGEPVLDEAGEPVLYEETRRSQFWEFMDSVKEMLQEISQNEHSVIVFGEMIGAGVQDLNYGIKRGIKFRVFDISINGNYIDFDETLNWCEKYNIETVPILYRGPFSMYLVNQYTDGPTTICKPEEAGKFKGREGIVIRPVKERLNTDSKSLGRAILKSISFNYLERKNGTEDH